MNIHKPISSKQHATNQYDREQQQNEYQLGPSPKHMQGFNQLPVQESQQSEEGDILQKIDSLLDQNNNNHQNNQQDSSQKSINKEMLLNMKINQMQKIIHNLNEANKKLNRKLQDFYTNPPQNTHKNNQSSSNVINSSSESNNPFNDQLTQMQGDFQQIQGLIQQYKDQLANSEKRWNSIKDEKDQQIEQLKTEIIALSQNRDVIESELNQCSEENQLLRNRNQQLLLEVQNLQQEIDKRSQLQRRSQIQRRQLQRRSQYSQTPYPTSPTRYSNYYQTPAKKFQSLEDYRFNQKIQRQLQTMIKKLLKQLSHQRKIKRLNSQVIELQKKIKHKNDHIYQLEMKLIGLEKMLNGTAVNSNSQYGNMLSNTRRLNTVHLTNPNSSIKYSPIPTNKAIQLTPTHNKDQSRVQNQQQQIRYQQRARQQIHMKDYDSPHYDQYDYQQQNNIYQDYVANYQQPIKTNRNPITKNKQDKLQKQQPKNNIKNQIVAGSKPQSKTTEKAFIKPRKTSTKQPPQDKQLPANSTSLPSTKQFISFTLMQLHQGRIKITMKQKIIIISKLIDLYCKKIKTQNYYNLIAEEIQVYNFNQKHSNLIRIRIVDAHSNNSKGDLSATLQQDTEESLMYNLAFIVENLVKEVETIDQKDLQVDLNLAEIIEEILTKSQEDKVAYFHELSKSLENSVNTLQ